MEKQMNCINIKGKTASKSGTAIFNTCVAMGMFPKKFTYISKIVEGRKVIFDSMYMRGKAADEKHYISIAFDFLKGIELPATLTSVADNLNDCLSMANLTKDDKLKLSVAIAEMQNGNFAEANSAALDVLKNNKYHMSIVADVMSNNKLSCADYDGLAKSDINMHAMHTF